MSKKTHMVNQSGLLGDDVFLDLELCLQSLEMGVLGLEALVLQHLLGRRSLCRIVFHQEPHYQALKNDTRTFEQTPESGGKKGDLFWILGLDTVWNCAVFSESPETLHPLHSRAEGVQQLEKNDAETEQIHFLVIARPLHQLGSRIRARPYPPAVCFTLLPRRLCMFPNKWAEVPKGTEGGGGQPRLKLKTEGR